MSVARFIEFFIYDNYALTLFAILIYIIVTYTSHENQDGTKNSKASVRFAGLMAALVFTGPFFIIIYLGEESRQQDRYDHSTCVHLFEKTYMQNTPYYLKPDEDFYLKYILNCTEYIKANRKKIK
jgi:hypothetical protein